MVVVVVDWLLLFSFDDDDDVAAASAWHMALPKLQIASYMKGASGDGSGLNDSDDDSVVVVVEGSLEWT
jgi:hypothetical protein